MAGRLPQSPFNPCVRFPARRRQRRASARGWVSRKRVAPGAGGAKNRSVPAWRPPHFMRSECVYAITVIIALTAGYNGMVVA